MSKFVTNLKEFFDYCKEHEVEFVDFRFSDISGVWHHITYNIKAIEEDAFTHGMPFDGSSLDGWQPINKSDMILMPEVSTSFLDPFSADPTIIVICDVYDIYKGQMYEKCPRSIAKKSLKALEDSGVADTAYFGPENEFFVFDNVQIKDTPHESRYRVDSEEGEWNDNKHYKDGINIGHRPRSKGGYFPVSPIDSMVDIRAEMMQTLELIGIETFVGHHEVAQAQGEIGVKFGTLIEAADNVQKYKYVVKMVAHLNGKTATFMPKPLYGDNGSGMHVHMSLWKDGKNLFFDKNGYCKISKMGLDYVGGILHHAHSVAAFTNASTNSYKRLIPGFEAPSILTYSGNNRSASCRIPYGADEKSARVEIRFPDSSSNPYLAFSSMLLAGLDGIKKQIKPIGPMDINLFDLTLREIREKGIEQMPHTLRLSLYALEDNHEYLSEVMSEEFIRTYRDLKFKNQVWPYEERPSAFEFKTTYSC